MTTTHPPTPIDTATNVALARDAVKRDRERNAVWVVGEAVHAHAIEALCAEVERLEAAVARRSPEGAETFGLPPDESPARDTVVELLTAELLAVGEIAEAACEATTLNLQSEQDMRGLMRFLTARDSGGRDGRFGERKRVFWERLGRALSPTREPTP